MRRNSCNFRFAFFVLIYKFKPVSILIAYFRYFCFVVCNFVIFTKQLDCFVNLFFKVSNLDWYTISILDKCVHDVSWEVHHKSIIRFPRWFFRLIIDIVKPFV